MDLDDWRDGLTAFVAGAVVGAAGAVVALAVGGAYQHLRHISRERARVGITE